MAPKAFWLLLLLPALLLAQDEPPVEPDTQDACWRPANCPVGWTHYAPTNKCFYVIGGGGLAVSFFTYQSICPWPAHDFTRKRACDGHLAQISNTAENAFVMNLARNKFFRRGAPTPTNLAEALMASVWIGYRVPGNADFLKKREFRWVDGSPNDFRNWIPSKAAKSVPYLAKQSDKRQSENCAVMSLDSSFPGMWTRIACNDEERIVGGAVCQIRLSGTSAPVPLGKG